MAERCDLLVIDTHPIQYRAPVFRWLHEHGLRIQVLYGSDCSVAGYRDPGFGQSFAWDQDLLAGYPADFLGTVATGATAPEFASSIGLEQQIERHQPRAILAHGYSPAFHRRVATAAFRARVPLLFRAETTHINPGKARLKQAVRDLWLRRFYRRCQSLLYIGESARRHYRERGVPEEKLHFSPYSVNPEPFRPSEVDRMNLRAQARAHLGAADASLILLMSGKLTPIKNPRVLIEAAARLSPELRRRVRLVYLGDGPWRAEVEAAAARAGLPATVTGFVNQRAISPWYHAADLLVLPSRFEKWGLVVNDALHHGLPCITADTVCGHYDLVVPGQTGFVYANGDAAALARSLEAGAAMVGRADIRLRCREQVARYSIEATARGILQALPAGSRP